MYVWIKINELTNFFWMKWQCQVPDFSLEFAFQSAAFEDWEKHLIRSRVTTAAWSVDESFLVVGLDFNLDSILLVLLYAARCCISYAYPCRLYSSFIGWIIFPGFTFCFISYVRLYYKRLEIIIIKCWRRRMIGILMCPQCGWIRIANVISYLIMNSHTLTISRINF